MENFQRPLLKLKPNKPVLVKFLYDTPLTGTSKYGNWYLYSFESTNEAGETMEYGLFVSDGLHQQIQKGGFKANDYAVLVKNLYEKEIEENNRTRSAYGVSYLIYTPEKAIEFLNEKIKYYEDLKSKFSLYVKEEPVQEIQKSDQTPTEIPKENIIEDEIFKEIDEEF